MVDWRSLICLVCERRLKSAELLQKHLAESALHKEKLAAYRQREAAAREALRERGAGRPSRGEYGDRGEYGGKSERGERDGRTGRARERFDERGGALAYADGRGGDRARHAGPAADGNGRGRATGFSESRAEGRGETRRAGEGRVHPNGDVPGETCAMPERGGSNREGGFSESPRGRARERV
jgi:ribonuclease E